MTIPATDAATSSALVTLWRSADGQGTIDMTGATAAEAVAELLSQCATDEQRAGILAGAFVVAPTSDRQPLAKFLNDQELTQVTEGVAAAVAAGWVLNNYASPSDDAAQNITVERAAELALDDISLVYLTRAVA